MKKINLKLSSILLISSSLIYLYTAAFGSFSAMNQRAIHWMLMTAAVFLLAVEKDIKEKKIKVIINTIYLAITIFIGVYIISTWHSHSLKLSDPTAFEITLGLLAVLIILEATRRTCGNFLAITTLIFLLYAVFGPYMPGFLGHRGESISRISYFLYMTTEGIFGIPISISATFIIVFVIFGAFLSECGGGQFFIDLAYSMTGKYRGGPAKTAVVASSLMGMISGSPVANVATTGTFTIPLMKKVGFKPHVAGAIEAAASTGGMFTPPIMGSAAFLIAQYLEIPYAEVAKAAILPAIFYYIALILAIDARAVKMGLQGLPQEELPLISTTIRERGLLALPLIFLVTCILAEWSPMKTAFWAIILTLIVSYLNASTRPKFSNIIKALESGSKNVIPIAVACSAAGIIVGIIAMTGLGIRMSSVMIDISGGNIYIALVLTMISAIVLGCGMPPPAVYIILGAIIAPSLVEMGMVPISAHMFIFIFASISAITPPVALAAYTAAGIANSEPNSTGLYAFRLGLVAFLIPYSFAVSPAILFQGTFLDVLVAAGFGILGVICLVIAVEGFLLIKWRPIARIILAVNSLLLMNVVSIGKLTFLVGIIIFALISILNNIALQKKVNINEHQ